MAKKLDISVIIPFHDHAKLTWACVKSLLDYGPVVNEVLLISNNSGSGELEFLGKKIETSGAQNVRILEYNLPFNYQKLNNWAIGKSTSSFILMLNNDTELVGESHGLIEKMFDKAAQKDVGSVGCLLLYGDRKTIQHAGVFLKPGLQGDHLYVGSTYKEVLDPANSSKFPYDIRKSRPLTAVTGAVMMIERKKFDEVAGFDDSFIICGGDVDLCIRLNKKGYQSWYSAGGYIVHKESLSRSFKPVPYIDFYHSYQSYITAYDLKHGDPYLPKITEIAR